MRLLLSVFQSLGVSFCLYDKSSKGHCTLRPPYMPAR
jgi:hypothetical protein